MKTRMKRRGGMKQWLKTTGTRALQVLKSTWRKLTGRKKIEQRDSVNAHESTILTYTENAVLENIVSQIKFWFKISRRSTNGITDDEKKTISMAQIMVEGLTQLWENIQELSSSK